MSKTVISFALWFVGLVLAQSVIFNNICILGYAVPLVFIYFIVKLPMSLSVNWVMTFSFLLGLAVDIFSDTYGVNAFSCTLLAFWRRPIFRAYSAKDEEMERQIPSVRSMGIGNFYKFLLSLTLVYCTVAFVVDSFGFYHPLHLLITIASSTLLTFLVIAAIDRLTIRKK